MRGGGERYQCNFCDWSTPFEVQLQVHVCKYHEAVLAREGEPARDQGRERTERTIQWLLRHGYVSCPHWSVPCPGPGSSLMQRVCQHLQECPGRG
ncbi:MAG: hypothetical protein V1849_01050 [Chloroflexota bacterium]